MEKRTTPLDFFLVLGMIAALYVSVGSLLTLLFDIINYQFPDALAYYADPYSGSMRFAVASLVILFPIYLLITWYLDRDYTTYPEKRVFAVRRWLIFFTLFIAGVGVIIDLIVLINTFLGGEITTRFILKVLAVLAVAGGVFWYYILDIRRDIRPRLFMMLSGAFVLISIVGSFFIMGSPTTQRDYRFDARRVSDLQQLQWQVANHWQQKEKLPLALSELEDALQGIIIPKDPETGIPYEYRIVPGKNLTFELCATFAQPSRDLKGRGAYDGIGMSSPYPRGGGFDDAPYFKHGEGKGCFERTIDPDLFPPHPEKPVY